MLYILGFVLLLVAVALSVYLFEQYMHPGFSRGQLINQAKIDIKKLGTDLLSSPRERFIIPEFELAKLKKILKPYAHSEFEIVVRQLLFKNVVPCVCGIIVPVSELSEEELITICELFHLKFKEIIAMCNKNYESFVTHYYDESHYYISAFYCEFPEDYPHYKALEKETIDNKVKKTPGRLIDEELEQELRGN